jgi:hypothetical protein
LKEVFISAAAGASNRKAYGSFLNERQKKGMRPEMARLTLARKIAATALAVWKKGEAFDPKKLNVTR